MAYKPTGRPVGRPKTKEYQTISLKIPTTLLDRVKTYAGRHRQSISELIREGLEWRIGEGDPLAQRYGSVDSAEQEHLGNTEIPPWTDRESESVGVLEEIRIALAQQTTQLQELKQAFEQRPVVSVPSEYPNTTMKVPTGQHSTPEPAPAGDTEQTPQTDHPGVVRIGGLVIHLTDPEENGNTVLPKHTYPFDPTKYVLGTLCQKKHDYESTGQSLRQIGGKHECIECKNARSRNYKQRQRQAKRQAAPA